MNQAQLSEAALHGTVGDIEARRQGCHPRIATPGLADEGSGHEQFGGEGVTGGLAGGAGGQWGTAAAGE